MHPPPWNKYHRLMDWPDCGLEVRCGCGRSSVYPCKLMAARHGNRTFSDVLGRIKCEKCGVAPVEIWLCAGHHRKHGNGGPPPDWALEIVPDRG